MKLMTFVLFVLAFSLNGFAHGPTRQQAEESIEIAASAQSVWAIVGDFTALNVWHPAVIAQENPEEGTRILDLGEGNKITEALKSLDDERMMLKYKITDMTVVETFEFAGKEVQRKVLPVDNYSSVIKVEGDDATSTVTWTGKFYRAYLLNPPTPEGMDDQTAINTMSAVYKAGLENLKEMLEQ